MGFAIHNCKAFAAPVLRYDNVTVKAEILFIMTDKHRVALTASKPESGQARHKPGNGRWLRVTYVDAACRVTSV